MAQDTIYPEDAFRNGQIRACEIFEEYILEQQKRGRQYWSADQIHQVIRSVRLNLELIFK